MDPKRLSWRFAGAKRLGSRLNRSLNCQFGVMNFDRRACGKMRRVRACCGAGIGPENRREKLTRKIASLAERLTTS
jgi:hypothetical protein